jgi:Gas vesicle protein G
MGILGSIVTAPVLGPFKGVLWVVGTIASHAERELYNEDNIRKELLKLEQQFELGKIAGEEFESTEGKLLERLNEARRMNEGR